MLPAAPRSSREARSAGRRLPGAPWRPRTGSCGLEPPSWRQRCSSAIAWLSYFDVLTRLFTVFSSSSMGSKPVNENKQNCGVENLAVVCFSLPLQFYFSHPCTPWPLHPKYRLDLQDNFFLPSFVQWSQPTNFFERRRVVWLHMCTGEINSGFPKWLKGLSFWQHINTFFRRAKLGIFRNQLSDSPTPLWTDTRNWEFPSGYNFFVSCDNKHRWSTANQQDVDFGLYGCDFVPLKTHPAFNMSIVCQNQSGNRSLPHC